MNDIDTILEIPTGERVALAAAVGKLPKKDQRVVLHSLQKLRSKARKAASDARKKDPCWGPCAQSLCGPMQSGCHERGAVHVRLGKTGLGGGLGVGQCGPSDAAQFGQKNGFIPTDPGPGALSLELDKPSIGVLFLFHGG